MQFQRATRKKSKLRLGVAGPAGSGKTTAALQIATGLGGRVAVLDTERGSASLYSDRFDFDVLDLDPPYAPERFIEAIKAAESAGYDVLILDSITHEWNGSGGCCDINEALAQARYKGNTWSAWSETTPRHRAFLDAILQSRMHIIATMRSKTETVQGDGGRVKKLGMKVEQRDGTDYEFSVVLELDHQTHFAVATKDRTRLFKDPVMVTAEVGVMLRNWLDSGAEIVPTAEEIAEKRRADLSLRFAQALNPTGDLGKTEEEHEAAVAAAVFAVHSEIRELGEEEYTAVWKMIPAPSRAAIKKYIDIAKAKKEAA
jgi:KaiC/GvpD/RAD55 family RecA-like ATPase